MGSSGAYVLHIAFDNTRRLKRNVYYFRYKDQLISGLSVDFGGRAAEEIIFKRISTPYMSCCHGSHSEHHHDACSTARAPRAEQACRAALQTAISGELDAWHNLLYSRLRDRAVPAVIHNDAITPAASLWTGSRLWLQAFRNTGLQPGHRLILALPESAEFIQVLVAALWHNLTIIPVRPDADLDACIATVDAHAVVHEQQLTPYTWVPNGCTGPRNSVEELRTTRFSAHPKVRFLMRTSGTTTPNGRWFAFSDANMLAVLASHLPYFSLKHGRALSVLPWSHAFGLVLDLLPALFSEAEIIRDPEGGRDPESILALRDAWGATHLSAVPLTMHRLLNHSRGPAFIRTLQGGIVGGAPINAPLAEHLQDASLRIGYGQTEASPGIALGDPGESAPNYLGQPLGCSVKVANNGELFFKGQNACIGRWTEDGLTPLDPNRWADTGDIVHQDGDDLYFRGRTDDAFKLQNGRMVQAGYLESVLKAAYPDAHNVMVYSLNGCDTEVAFCWPKTTTAPPTQQHLHATLGTLQPKPTMIRRIPPAHWPTDAKGATDRAALTEHLAQHNSTQASLSSP